MGFLDIFRFKHCLFFPFFFFQCFNERFKHCLLESTKKGGGKERKEYIYAHISPKKHIQRKIHDNFHITLWDVLFLLCGFSISPNSIYI